MLHRTDAESAASLLRRGVFALHHHELLSAAAVVRESCNHDLERFS